nr:MAG TPA: hypothetical protein [Caudoviricetes sp.]
MHQPRRKEKLMITGLVGTVFDADEPPFVSISVDMMLDGEEHYVNIYWYPETDEVSVERMG